MHILILCYKVLIHDSVRRTWALYARAVRSAWDDARRVAEHRAEWLAGPAYITLQGSCRVVLRCKPGSSEELTPWCLEALAHEPISGTLRGGIKPLQELTYRGAHHCHNPVPCLHLSTL